MWPFDTEEIEGKATADAYSVLYSRVHGGPGVAGLSQTVGSFREQIKGDFANAEQALHDALTRAGATWAGGASDAMQAGLRPMAAFSSDSASAADQMAGTVQTEADGFADAKNGMPEPVTVTATDNALERGAAHLFGNQTDMEEQEAAKEAAEAEGYRVYREYDGTSSGNIGSAAIYPAAPRLAVGASDPGAQGVQVTGPAGTSTQGAGAAPAASVAPPPGG
ncbi:MAG: PPE domain-containing protein, partial [Pseudonocardiaceae bacterium]